jgi:LuxR family maltose regulon positive regulatory protein
VWLELPHVTHCRRLVAAGSDDSLKEASERLDVLLEAAGAIHNTFHLIDILVLKALAFYKRSRVKAALKALKQALSLAIPGGWIRPFVEPGHPMPDMLARLEKQNIAVDYIEQLLVSFRDPRVEVPTRIQSAKPMADKNYSPPNRRREKIPNPKPKIQNPLVDSLSNREMDVLELLAKRLQNKEIAEKLSISPETVRTHLGHIYQKLSAANRRQAVAMAKDLGVL